MRVSEKKNRSNGYREPLNSFESLGTLNVFTPKRITMTLWENFMRSPQFREEYRCFLDKNKEEVDNSNFYYMLNRKTVKDVIEYLQGKKVIFNWTKEELALAKSVELKSLQKFEWKYCLH